MELVRERKGWDSQRPRNWALEAEATAAPTRVVQANGLVETPDPATAQRIEVEAALAIFDEVESEPEPEPEAPVAPLPELAIAPRPGSATVATHDRVALTTESLDNAAELRLDTTAVGDGAFGGDATELPVRGLSLDDVHADAVRIAGPRTAVAFDADRPIFRRRQQPYQRSVEEALSLERARSRREAAITGAVVFLVLVAAIPMPSSIFLLYAAVVGACVGVASDEMGGGVEVWCTGSIMGAAALLPFAEGREFFLLAAALAVSGSVVGHVRSRK